MECILKKTDSNACKYLYKDKNNNEQLINEDFCECSLMEQRPRDGKNVPPKKFQIPKYLSAERDIKNTQRGSEGKIDYGMGYCPIPPQKYIDRYI